MKAVYKIIVPLTIALCALLAQCSFDTVSGVKDGGGTSIEVVGVRGVVVDKNLRPAASASLILRRGGAVENSAEVRGRATTTEDGRFFIPEGGSGRYLVTAKDELGNGVSHSFSIDVGSDGMNVDTLQLRRTGSIGVKVLCDKGIGLNRPVYIDCGISKKDFASWVDSTLVRDSTQSGDIVEVKCTQRELPPDTYKVEIDVSFSDENTRDNWNQGGGRMRLDTVIILGEGENVMLPDFRLSTLRSPELDSLFQADSAALVSLYRKCGVPFSTVDLNVNSRNGRIENLMLKEANGVTFNEIAPELGQLDGLINLALADVKGDSLPEAICRMSRLKYLYLRNGTLTWIPREIGKLPRLYIVSLVNQQLNSIPSFLDDIKPGQLYSVFLDGNPIVISNWVEQQRVNEMWARVCMFSLPPIQQNDFLSVRKLLEGNGFGEVVVDTFITSNADGRVTAICLPPELPLHRFPEDLGMLDSLHVFAVGRHSFESIPEWFSGCKTLKVLKLPNGNLTTLPHFLAELSLLRYLDVANNRLAEVPVWVGNLDVAYLQYASSTWSLQPETYKQFRRIADFTGNRIVPERIRYTKPICVTDPQLPAATGEPDNALLEQDLAIAKKLVLEHKPYTFYDRFPTPTYGDYIRIINGRVYSIALSLRRYDLKEYFENIFVDLAKLDSVKTIYFDPFLAEEVFESGALDSVLKTIPVRLPAVTNLVFCRGYDPINGIPEGFFEIMPNVKHVGLQDMGFKSVPAILKNRPGIESVNMFCNPLTEISDDDRRWLDTHCRIIPVEYGNPILATFFPEGVTWRQSSNYGLLR